MTEVPLSPADQRVADAKAIAGPQSARLHHISTILRDIAPEYMDIVDRLVVRLQNARTGAQAPQVGDPMPGFVLPDEEGRLVSLDQLLEKGPLAVVLLRGHWCPFCRINAAGFAEVEPELGVTQLVAITPETQRHRRAHKQDAGAGFPFLMDMDLGYAMSLGLAVWVEDRLAELIAAAGYDIPAYQAMKDWLLPIPAVFVVGQDGIVTYRRIDLDYRERMEPRELLAAASDIAA